jgi:hypothetical protein
MNFTKISRELIKSLEFRPFTKTDYYGFCDVQSPIPLIADNEDEGILMIIDGCYAELYCYDGEGNIEVVDQCMDIRELPVKSEKQLRIEAEIAAMEQSIAALRAELTA